MKKSNALPKFYNRGLSMSAGGGPEGLLEVLLGFTGKEGQGDGQAEGRVRTYPT